MVRRSLIVLLFALACFGRQTSTAEKMYGSNWIFIDSLRVDSTQTVTTKAFGVEKGARLTILIEARDDSAAGFASDSASVQVKLMQVFPVNFNGAERFVKLESTANPDSTHADADWILFDSLDILDMDTAAVFYRNYVLDTLWDRSQKKVYGDSILTNDTVLTVGAFEYVSISPDVSPAIALQFTGNLRNKILGVGSRWIVRVCKPESMETR